MDLRMLSSEVTGAHSTVKKHDRVENVIDGCCCGREGDDVRQTDA